MGRGPEEVTFAFCSARVMIRPSLWIDTVSRSGSAELFAPSYTTLDLAVEYAVDESWSVYGRVANLTDDDYQSPLGFLQPSRAFYAGLRGRF